MTSLISNLICLIICVSFIKAFEYESNKNYYTAGVVEFRPILSGMSSADMLADHLNAYNEIIRSEAANETDIIVFPEGTLNNVFQMTFVPAPSDDIIPCLQHEYKNNNFADFFIQLSCIARDVRKYLVINLTEKENCTKVQNDPRPCANSGLNIYNTNIVFDRTGRIISRYRKVHIYVEAKNTTLEPEYAIFETDFGVRFGHFICFDILFYTPAQELVTKYGVKDVIFTSLFYSELPFLTAVQLQQSWAWGNNVNLLAAGASYPTEGITGSGIYAGNAGDLISVMAGDIGERKLYVSRVPKSVINRKSTLNENYQYKTAKRQTGIKLMKDPNIHKFNSKLLDFGVDPHVSANLCFEGFCCKFIVNVTFSDPPKHDEFYKYRFGVFDGRRTYEKEEWSDIKVCALYSCTANDPESCGEIFDANTKVASNVRFEYIEIQGYFDKVGEPLIMPSTLTDELYSMNSNDIEWKVKSGGDMHEVNLKLLKPNERLLTFGIYAHYFERSGSTLSKSYLWFLMFSLILTISFNNYSCMKFFNFL